MKKILNLMIAVCCVLSCAFVFSGCDMAHKEHKASEDWTMNSTHHWHECSECGDKIDKAEHDWKETILEEATQTEEGIKHYECKSCGMDKVEEYVMTTVTEEIWNTALKLNTLDKFKVTGQMEQASQTVIKDGDIIYNYLTEDNRNNGYFSKEGEKYYHYKQESGIWTKTETNNIFYNSLAQGVDISSQFTELNIDYIDFVYNEDLQTYEYEDEREWEEGETYTKSWTLYFECGKLVKMECDNYTGQNKTLTWTFEYDNIELELPAIG